MLREGRFCAVCGARQGRVLLTNSLNVIQHAHIHRLPFQAQLALHLVKRDGLAVAGADVLRPLGDGLFPLPRARWPKMSKYDLMGF